MRYLVYILFLFCAIVTAQTQKVEIYSADVLLNAYFYQAESDTKKPTLIWCHGNPGSKEEGNSEFANELNKLGINVIRFNYRGLWETGGVYKLSNAIEDLSNVLDFIYNPENATKYKIDTNRIIVGSYSFGTTVALVSALEDERIKNIFCLGIADHNYFYFTPGSLHPNNKGSRREALPIVKDAIWGPKQNLDALHNAFHLDILKNTYTYDFVSQAEKLKDKNIFIVVGLNDRLTPIEYHFLPLHRKFTETDHISYKYKIVESDHSFKNLSAQERAEMILNWINE